MEILQPGEGPIRAERYLSADPASVFWGRLPCETDAPLVWVDPGEELTVDTISHEGVLADQGQDPLAFFAGHGLAPEAVLRDAVELAATRTRDPETDGPHVNTGPIGVRGAQPGDLLAVRMVELVPRVPYGVISNRHGRGALPGELPRGGATVSVFAEADFDDAEFDGGSRTGVGRIARRLGAPRDAEFPLAPFLGTVGVAVAGPNRPHSVPPGRHGGNIDIRLLTVGSTLFLPVQVVGAGAYLGDPHFAQGDGEVALTAMEASLRATVRFEVLPAAHPAAAFAREFGPFLETPDWLVPTGLDADLREAMKSCVRASIAMLRARAGFDEAHAYAYLSAGVDFDVSQVVDQVCGVHARLPRSVMDEVGGDAWTLERLDDGRLDDGRAAGARG